MKKLIIIFILSFSFQVLAKENKKSFQVKNIGTFQIISRIAGEPVDAPERLTISLTCKQSNKKIVFFDDKEFCKYLGYKVEDDYLLVLEKSYNPNTGICSISNNHKVSFKGSCKN